VEPFMGSAAVFFNKPLAEKNVINDLDKDTVQRMRMIKKAPNDLTKYRDDLNTLEKTKYFFDNHTTSEADLLTLEKIKTCNGFSGVYANTSKQVYRVSNPYYVIKNIDEYKSKLNRATIENKDYEKIIKKYDSKDTFFFIDPPYENTDTSFNYAEDTDFDFGRLVEVLKGIKGKFLMTLNDSQNIRQLFKHFYIKPFKVLNPWFNKQDKGEKYRREVFIANYSL
jgi:DNA adenine methylase